MYVYVPRANVCFPHDIQVVRIKIPGTKFYVGSGLLSVMGTSFTFLPIAQRSVAAQMTDPDDPKDFPTAFGSLLGVFMIGSFVEMAMSFIPPRFLRKIFPPWISGLTIFLIGASLIGSGVKVSQIEITAIFFVGSSIVV
jgi:NCS2 family nucleobase:cation symporter-2